VSGLVTLKVDAETHRLIGDLAHLLGRTRKDVVRDAVNAFAVWRESVLDEGAEASSERLVLANARHSARLASGDLASSAAERAGRSRIGTVRISDAMFLQLTVHERFELRRAELERAFGELGARNPRLVDPRDYGRAPSATVILVDLDDPDRFAFGELVMAALETISEIVTIEATNGYRRPIGG
jgi:predicted transcriptional regulator